MEFLLGIDDTDIPDWPGTNKLAMGLAEQFSKLDIQTQWILRHQLWLDPRVPFTSGNGSASLKLQLRSAGQVEEIIAIVCQTMQSCPEGSDPALGLIELEKARQISCFGWKATREWVEVDEARALAMELSVPLQTIKGRDHGIVGALAAIGLAATGDHGRVVYHAKGFGLVEGVIEIQKLSGWGIQVVEESEGRVVTSGMVELPKKLRPNMRKGRIVLFVEKGGERDYWKALKRD